jgi:hypothetical protein
MNVLFRLNCSLESDWQDIFIVMLKESSVSKQDYRPYQFLVCTCQTNFMLDSFISIRLTLPGVKCSMWKLYHNVFFLVYSTSNQENTVNQLLYPGFVEEFDDAIRLNDTNPRYAVCFVLVFLLKHPNSFSHYSLI